MISGEYGRSAPAKTAPIGFKRSTEELVAPDGSSVIEYNELVQRCGQRAEVDNVILTVVRDYMDKRVKLCYTEGLNEELMAKLDKIFIRHFDKSF